MLFFSFKQKDELTAVFSSGEAVVWYLFRFLAPLLSPRTRLENICRDEDNNLSSAKIRLLHSTCIPQQV